MTFKKWVIAKKKGVMTPFSRGHEDSRHCSRSPCSNSSGAPDVLDHLMILKGEIQKSHHEMFVFRLGNEIILQDSDFGAIFPEFASASTVGEPSKKKWLPPSVSL